MRVCVCVKIRLCLSEYALVFVSVLRCVFSSSCLSVPAFVSLAVSGLPVRQLGYLCVCVLLCVSGVFLVLVCVSVCLSASVRIYVCDYVHVPGVTVHAHVCVCLYVFELVSVLLCVSGVFLVLVCVCVSVYTDVSIMFSVAVFIWS